MKKLLSISFRFSPFIVLFGIMIYLRAINSVSEVYIDLVASKMSFVISEERDELISADLPVDSLQLRNCNLKLKLGTILDSENQKVMPASRDLYIAREDRSDDSEIHLSKQNYLSKPNYMLLKNLHVPAFSQVDLIRENETIRIELTHRANSGEKIRGEIDADGKFLFNGRNVKLEGMNQYSKYDVLAISTHSIFKKLIFDADTDNITMILSVSRDEEIISEIFKNLDATNVSLVEIDRTRRKNRETSTVLSGDIQIAGTDFFNKRFLLKEEKLAWNDFIDIADNDQYFISSVSLTENAFKISMSCEEATELKTGKRIRLLRSIFPSLLEFLIAEPSNKTFWTILAFVLTQFSFLPRTLRSYFLKGKSTE